MMRRRPGAALAALLLTPMALLADSARAADCAALAGLSLPHTELSAATPVAAGAFSPAAAGPGAARLQAAMHDLPAFCRITATARPTSDSTIGIEVWLPADGWNGKLQGVGNGAWAGSIGYSALADALRAGYAAASTDGGHRGNDAAFGFGHPEKLADFAYRAVHEMTLTAKRLVEAYYGGPAERAYFVGCSTGGRQALTEAQRYPDDYDGIVAGAAAYYPSHLQGMQVWTSVVANRSGAPRLTTDLFARVNDAAVAACDADDGVADGVIENPRACDFDPAALVCDGGGTCLSEAEAGAVSELYTGPRGADGRVLFPGLERGSERGWRFPTGSEPMALALDTYRYYVFGDPDWDYLRFDPATDIPLAEARIGAVMNATDPDLAAFVERGGKLLLYHGWNDPGIPPRSTVRYYEAVRAALGPDATDASVQLFMVPGMNHCRGGVGTDEFDAVTALDRWLATGTAPARIEAGRKENGTTVRTRPLCPYPQVAVYDGSGSTDAAENFSCR